LKVEKITIGKREPVWWQCVEHTEHKWQALIKDRIQGQGCPFCSGQRTDEINCLASVNPELALEWHPTLNSGVTASDVTSKSGRKVWWLCPHCNYEWSAVIAARTVSGCPACNGKGWTIIKFRHYLRKNKKHWLNISIEAQREFSLKPDF